MKTLHNFRYQSVRFLFHSLEKKEADSSAVSDETKLTVERKAELNKEQKSRSYQATINHALDAVSFANGEDMSEVFAYAGQKEKSMLSSGIEEEEMKKFPKGFEQIPASEFLTRKPEELQKLFLVDGVVSFHGNHSAEKYIGAGDLYPSSQKFITVDGVVGQRSIDSKFNETKVGYVDKSGNYLAITGEEEITLDFSEEETKGFEPTAIDDDFEYTNSEGVALRGEAAYQAQFVSEIKADEERDEKMLEEMDEATKDMEGVENMEWREKYVATATKYAKVIEKQLGIPYEVTVVQACLESGYGKHAKGGNHFGIKSLSSKENIFQTTEFFTDSQFASWKKSNPDLVDRVVVLNNGQKDSQGRKKYSLPDKFNSYGSMQESFLGYAKFIKKPNSKGEPTGRYADAFKYTDSPSRFLEEVITSGYATSPVYLDSAARIARELGLQWEG